MVLVLCFFFYSVINELDGLKRDFHVDKYSDLQHAQYVLENARYVGHIANLISCVEIKLKYTSERV